MSLPENLSLKMGEILKYAASIEELHEIAESAVNYLQDIIYLNHMQDAKALNNVIWEAKDILESFGIFGLDIEKP
jgi:hypothetical protein